MQYEIYNELNNYIPTTTSKKCLTIIITTFKRNLSLNNILYTLDNQLTSIEYNVILVDDDPENQFKFYNPKNYQLYYVKNNINYGKKYYFVNWHNIINNLLNKSLYYIFMVDDMCINKNFVNLALTYWIQIKDKKKIILNLYNDRKKSWTNMSNTEYNKNTMRCGWNETFFICENKFLEKYKNFRKIFRKKSWIRSSGVPSFFSYENYKSNLNMFVVKKSLGLLIKLNISKLNESERIRKKNFNNFYTRRALRSYY